MKILSNKYFLLVLRVIVGGVFIYASLDKLMNQEEFSRAIYNYKFLPEVFVNIFAIVMPYLELFCGILLILGIFKGGSSFIITVMLLMFIIALSQAYFRGLDISCGCFSLETVSQKSDILQRIFEDILLILSSIIIFTQSLKPDITNNKNNINISNNKEKINE
ncbi:MAG TPA: MauE/DoxX family redox-associated membrane protein [Ignavibacteria bacterium]|nr:MauE/DoxX family redox-associated membrane protein [Ignavibacteria bacterium]HQY51608.1 MauE/DoxX family redox-associated membrane protein [Ignavibacteria bacterium]HRA99601.1 MauE/DoxX family redox-associated membrane protein [Ignavibacteria bacterium]